MDDLGGKPTIFGNTHIDPAWEESGNPSLSWFITHIAKISDYQVTQMASSQQKTQQVPMTGGEGCSQWKIPTDLALPKSDRNFWRSAFPKKGPKNRHDAKREKMMRTWELDKMHQGGRQPAGGFSNIITFTHTFGNDPIGLVTKNIYIFQVGWFNHQP